MSKKRSNLVLFKENFLSDLNNIEMQTDKFSNYNTLTKSKNYNFSLNYKKPTYNAIKKEFPSNTKNVKNVFLITKKSF